MYEILGTSITDRILICELKRYDMVFWIHLTSVTLITDFSVTFAASSTLTMSTQEEPLWFAEWNRWNARNIQLPSVIGYLLAKMKRFRILKYVSWKLLSHYISFASSASKWDHQQPICEPKRYLRCFKSIYNPYDRSCSFQHQLCYEPSTIVCAHIMHRGAKFFKNSSMILATPFQF